MSASMHRRQFLKTSASTILASSITSRTLFANPKTEAGLPIIESGDWKFECHHDWAKVPETIRFRNTHGVAISKDGTVFITHQGDQKTPCDTVVAFDPTGRYIHSFAKEFAGGNHGIDIREENGTEFIYCSVNAPHRCVAKFDLKGELVWKQPAPEAAGVYDDRNGYSPTNVCFGPAGELYVSDGYGSHYIHQYDKDGNWIRTFGGLGELLGQFKTPHGLWLDNRIPESPRIVVADRANSRLQFFKTDLKATNAIQGVKFTAKAEDGKAGTQNSVDGEKLPIVSRYGISYPSAIDSQGEFLVVADLHSRVTILNGNNEIVANLGFDEPWTAQVLEGRPFKMRTDSSTWKAGKFIHPHDATFDPHGNLFVTEWVEQGRVNFLKRIS